MSPATFHQKLKNQLAAIYNKNEISQFWYMLAEHYLKLSKTDLLIRREQKITDIQQLELDKAIERLAQGEPIQYILGYTEFYDLRLKVAPGVLIPRPETEELVHWIISEHSIVKDKISVIDIGCGSGCISISIALNIEKSKVYALDNDPAALQICRENVRMNNAPVEIIQADILEYKKDIPAINPDIIVSNPPYVLNSDKKFMHKNVLHYEPENALFVSDDDPLFYYTAIAKYGQNVLKKGGYIYLEIHEKMGSQMKSLLEDHNYKGVIIKKDIHEKERMLRARYEG